MSQVVAAVVFFCTACRSYCSSWCLWLCWHNCTIFPVKLTFFTRDNYTKKKKNNSLPLNPLEAQYLKHGLLGGDKRLWLPRTVRHLLATCTVRTAGFKNGESPSQPDRTQHFQTKIINKSSGCHLQVPQPAPHLQSSAEGTHVSMFQGMYS